MPLETAPASTETPAAPSNSPVAAHVAAHPAAVQPAPAPAPQPAPVQAHAGPTPPQQSAAGPPPARDPQAPTHVQVPIEQLTAYTNAQIELQRIRHQEEQNRVDAEREKAALMARNGEVENALRILREQSDQQVASERKRLEQAEQRAKHYALDGELSRVLANAPLVPGGAEQLTRLWKHEFQVDAEGESFKVRTPTFQSVGDFVQQQLGRPEYHHFIRASSQGGTAMGGSSAAATIPTPPANIEPPKAPEKFSEFFEGWARSLPKGQSPNAAMDMSKPIGLKAPSR